MRSKVYAGTALLGAAALLASLSMPTSTAGYSLLGESLGLDQRDFRVHDVFLDGSANDNTTPHPNFPGHTGAVMAIWKAHSEWGSVPRGGNGLGDGLGSNANLGDGDANFDNSFQGTAASSGGMNGNVHTSTAIGGAVLAFTVTPISDGWQIVYGEDFAWDDGPGEPDVGTIDLQAIATHEIGHSLGLGHSLAFNATMAAALGGPVTSARSIEADDIAGIQAIYGEASASKPRIDTVSGSTDVGGLLVIDGANFNAVGNEVWFTKTESDGEPVKQIGVTSSAGGSHIEVTIPAGAAAGDVLVKLSGSAGASLSNAFPLDIGSQPGTFGLTGPGLAGLDDEVPQLTASGDLTPGSALGVSLHLRLVRPSAAGGFFVSTSEGNLPFKGGVFDPVPILLQLAFTVDGSGELDLSGAVPLAVPPGSLFITQAWFSDAAAVFGASGSNGLSLAVP